VRGRLDSDQSWLNDASFDSRHRLQLKRGDEFHPDLDLSSKIDDGDIGFVGYEVWLHGGDLLVVNRPMREERRREPPIGRRVTVLIRDFATQSLKR
jgi:hypothetical protein